MKKYVRIALYLALPLFVFPQQKIHVETVVVNIEVPVRVFNGEKFVDNLTIDDFDVYEEGIPQKIEAVYLVKKRTIERRQEKRKFTPKTARNYYLIFEMSEFMPKLIDVVRYFVQNVFFPGDHLTIVTPIKTYRLKDNTFEMLKKINIIQQLKGILRKDTMIGSAEYRSAVADLTGLARSLTAAISQEGIANNSPNTQNDFSTAAYKDLPIELQLNMYSTLLNKLENLRFVNQNKLMQFARYLNAVQGQKYVFLFHQREYIPVIQPRILNQYMSLYQDHPEILQTISDLFDFYKRDLSLDMDLIEKAYSDSSISMHFLYITKPPPIISGVLMEEHSEDIFSAFRKMAQASGGFVDSSANPYEAFRQAISASQNYYLLYYTPIDYKRDGQFKKIKVTVKNNAYKIIHRAGYYAN